MIPKRVLVHSFKSMRLPFIENRVRGPAAFFFNSAEQIPFKMEAEIIT